MLPEIDGFKLLEELQKNEKYKTIPVIIITARVVKGEKEKCMINGAKGYINKPVQIAELLKLIKACLN
jgi:DNA-binding response OmpR family regulator